MKTNYNCTKLLSSTAKNGTEEEEGYRIFKYRLCGKRENKLPTVPRKNHFGYRTLRS